MPTNVTVSIAERPRVSERAAAASCAHCRLPVPAGLLKPEARHQFCCSGCDVAWRLIHESGLDDYYALCEELESQPHTAIASDDHYEEFDHPAFQDRYVSKRTATVHEAVLLLDGLTCTACVWLLEKLPQLIPGLIEARVNLARQTATIRWDNHAVALSHIACRLADLGYVPHPATREARSEQLTRENRRHLLRLAVAGACAGNAMLIAIALYAGQSSGIAAEHVALFRWISAGLGLVSLAWPGATFYRGAWRAIRNRSPHMDVSLTLGLLAGGAMGLVNTSRGAGEIYFDSLCMLIFVLLVGRYIQFRQQQRAVESVDLLRDLTPRTALRLDLDGTRTKVPVDALRVGELVEVRAGDLIPADGHVESGQSSLDQSLLTGESAGVPVEAGDQVTAGATNLTSPIRVRVSAVGRDSRIGQISEIVESASLSHTPIVELANRVSGIFLFVVLGLAVMTMWLWLPVGTDAALDHTIALLIVACPCALGLATPLTIAIALGRAAQNSILIRGADVFERLHHPGALWLDKTGTLTVGRMSVQAWYGDESVQPYVRALEQNILHPIAKCLVRCLPAGDDKLMQDVADLICEPGRGVRGTVAGRHLLVGSRRFLEEQGIDLAPEQNWDRPASSDPETIVYIAEDGRLIALVVLGDVLRPDAALAVQQLRKLGWQVGILSGDQTAIVKPLAHQLGIADELAIGAALPEEKLSVIRRGPASQTVVMVGDGVNDAAALAAADVGVAVHGGAEASLQAAPVYLGQPGLSPLIGLMQGSRRTVAAIHYGLALSLIYNLVAVGLAVAGMITPLLAAVIMPLSSLSVTTLALLQRTFPRPS